MVFTVGNGLYSLLHIYFFMTIKLCNPYQFTFDSCPIHIGQPCEQDNIKFYLLKNKTHIELLDPYKPQLPNYFNKSAPTKIIINGYSATIDYGMTILAQEYLKYTKVNIILVDWNLTSSLACYSVAVVKSWEAGQCTAVLVVSLAALGIDPNKLHVLGFSLGAHVASFTGNWILATMGVKIGRITGLDPALPFFVTVKSALKLDASDADFVDIIHTNSGFFGKIEPTGHVDFYVNGGVFQPVCANSKSQRVCSHMLAPVYFAESIPSETAFLGVRCPGYLPFSGSWCQSTRSTNKNVTTAIMGEHCNARSRGIYFVDTAASSPFSITSKKED